MKNMTTIVVFTAAMESAVVRQADNDGGTTMTIRRVGFVGLGAIGEPMARRVLQAGFELHVWNRNVSKTAGLVAARARAVVGVVAQCN